MRGRGLQTSFLQTKAHAIAGDSSNGSNEDDTTVCLVFLVYLSADVSLYWQEVCVNLAMPLGIGAGALVLAIGILSILFYKCYIEVRLAALPY
jgi:hypothetical protein